MERCQKCGILNKCCIARIDPADRQVKKYCCMCRPESPPEFFGHPLANAEPCEVLNELCCFSKRKENLE